MEQGTPEQQERSRSLTRQRDFLAGLRNLAKEIKQNGGSRPKKVRVQGEPVAQHAHTVGLCRPISNFVGDARF